MPPILNAQTITKQFGAKPLFKDISFTVEDGVAYRADRPERGWKVDAAGDSGGGG